MLRTWLVFALLISLYVHLTMSSKIETDATLDEAWLEYKTTYGKIYPNYLEKLRRLIWEENLEDVRAHNLLYDLGQKSYSLGINEFSDLTFAEFKEQYLGLNLTHLNFTGGETFLPPLNTEELPNEVDWRKKGYVTEVKNQKTCGSCWAFSTTGSLEGQHFRKTKRLVSFSEQQLVDCSKSNHGCRGGYPTRAFKYIQQYGIEPERAYPYVGKDEPCRYQPSKVAGKCSGFVLIPPGNENALKSAVASVGPISVLMFVDKKFMQYKNGVYNEPQCPNALLRLNHAVLAVGYGTQQTKDYWLVKNSWGKSWGMGGYVMMSRNKNNQCGIATQPSYPRV